MDLQTIIKNVIILITLLLSTVYSIFKFLSNRRQKGVRFDGIEKVSKEIIRLNYEKIEEQLKIIKERCNILYSEFVDVFCKNMNVSTDSKQARGYDAFILHELRKMTDQIMDDVVHRNNLANRYEKNWEEYKKGKLEYILTEVLKFIPKIWNDELIFFSYEETVEKCRKDNVSLYSKHVNEMFEEIRDIAINYRKLVVEQQSILNRLKDHSFKINTQKV